MTDGKKLVACPQGCKRGDGRPRHLTQLATRQEPGSTWRAFEDPLDGVRVYACPVHGRFELDRDGDLHKPRRR